MIMFTFNYYWVKFFTFIVLVKFISAPFAGCMVKKVSILDVKAHKPTKRFNSTICSL